MTHPVPRVAALIVAAGAATRMGAAEGKILQELGGRRLIEHTVGRFQAHAGITDVCVVARAEDRDTVTALFADKVRWSKVTAVVSGGAERQESVRKGLDALAAGRPEWVLVHDGARPLCPARVIDEVLAALRDHPAAVPTLPLHDSVRRITAHGSEVVERQGLHRVQTPQGFHRHVLREAHDRAARRGDNRTDDAQLVEALGIPLHFTQGALCNLKVTTPEELALLRDVLAGACGLQDPVG